jgi:hypothetical protein
MSAKERERLKVQHAVQRRHFPQAQAAQELGLSTARCPRRHRHNQRQCRDGWDTHPRCCGNSRHPCYFRELRAAWKWRCSTGIHLALSRQIRPGMARTQLQMPLATLQIALPTQIILLTSLHSTIFRVPLPLALVCPIFNSTDPASPFFPVTQHDLIVNGLISGA